MFLAKSLATMSQGNTFCSHCYYTQVVHKIKVKIRMADNLDEVLRKNAENQDKKR